MKTLIPCPHCQCHVRSSEPTCPFCEASLEGLVLPTPVETPRGLSRSAAFAMRAAVVAGVATVVACGGEAEDDSRPKQQATGGAPSGGTTSSGGATTDTGGATTGGSQSSGGALATGGTIGTGGESVGGEGGFVPIPIYGGVFPDPELRAKV